MEICRFLNSRDVADHLREIGYEFTAPEAAFIVYRSNDATLDEKIAAWQEIAETMSDCSMEGRRNMNPIPSFRAFLHDYIDLQKRMLAWFEEPDRCVYVLYCPDGDGDWEQDESVFSDTESCLERIKSCFGGRWYQEEAPRRYMIEKRPVNRPNSVGSGTMLLNASLEVRSISRAHLEEADLGLSLQFDGMWFAIPTPFKRGDIVCGAGFNSRAIVIDSLPSWGKEKCIENGFSESDEHTARADSTFERLARNGDISDMDAYGFFTDDDGDVWCDSTGCNYLDLRYLRVVGGSSRWVFVVRAFLDGQITLGATWNSFHYLRVDSDAQKLKQKYGHWTPEWLRFDKDTRKWTRD